MKEDQIYENPILDMIIQERLAKEGWYHVYTATLGDTRTVFYANMADKNKVLSFQHGHRAYYYDEWLTTSRSGVNVDLVKVPQHVRDLFKGLKEFDDGTEQQA